MPRPPIVILNRGGAVWGDLRKLFPNESERVFELELKLELQLRVGAVLGE